MTLQSHIIRKVVSNCNIQFIEPKHKAMKKVTTFNKLMNDQCTKPRG